MTPRARRWLGVVLALALTLILGRALADALVAGWWVDSLGPTANQLVRQQWWFARGLDLAGVVLATAWFVAHAAVLTWTRDDLLTERDSRPRTPTRPTHRVLLLLGALALGLVVGSGVSRGRDLFALAWQGVHYGVNDPILGLDLGQYLTTIPVWARLQASALALIGFTLGLVLIYDLVTGAIRVGPRVLVLTGRARRHVGGLLTLLALVIATGYLLEPYQLVTRRTGVLSAAAIDTRIVTAYAMAGAAVAVAMMSARWAATARHALLLAGWTVLGLGVATASIIVPAFVAEGARGTVEADNLSRVTELFYAVARVDSGAARTSSVRSIERDLWDPALLERIAAGRGEDLLGVQAVAGAVGAPWQVAVGSGGDAYRVTLRHIIGDSVGPTGLPMASGDSVVIGEVAIRPGAVGWKSAPEGVRVGTLVRRLPMAWALQAPGLLTTTADQVLWRRDPAERAGTVMPALTWRVVGVVGPRDRPQWLLLGAATAGRVPYGVSTSFAGRVVQAVAPAVVATVDMRNGQLRGWVDPAADPLGRAWARVYYPLVDSTPPPPTLRGALPYAADWFAAQATAYQVVHPAAGRRPVGVVPVTAGHRAGRPVVTTVLEAIGTSRPTTLLMGQRVNGLPVLETWQVGALAGVATAELVSAWRSHDDLIQLGDSLRAAGDTLMAGPVHHALGQNGVESWQVFSSAGRRGSARVLWIGTAAGNTVAGGRRPALAWSASDAAPTSGERIDEAVRLEVIRGWVRRADSALARNDLTAFGRAWEAIHGLLLDHPRE